MKSYWTSNPISTRREKKAFKFFFTELPFCFWHKGHFEANRVKWKSKIYLTWYWLIKTLGSTQTWLFRFKTFEILGTVWIQNKKLRIYFLKHDFYVSYFSQWILMMIRAKKIETLWRAILSRIPPSVAENLE